MSLCQFLDSCQSDNIGTIVFGAIFNDFERRGSPTKSDGAGAGLPFLQSMGGVVCHFGSHPPKEGCHFGMSFWHCHLDSRCHFGSFRPLPKSLHSTVPLGNRGGNRSSMNDIPACRLFLPGKF